MLPYIYVGMCQNKHDFIMMRQFIYGVLLAHNINQARIMAYQALEAKYDRNDFDQHYVMIELFDDRFHELAKKLGYDHAEQ